MRSVIGGASALQQAMQWPEVAAAPTVEPMVATGAPPTLANAAVEMPSAASTQEDADSGDAGLDESQQRHMEAARLTRIEEGLLAKLERLGSLSPAEEGRLRNV